MNYRDERDALRGRVDGLEQDLEDARRDQQDDAAKRARVEQIEARMRETEDNLRAMRAELVAIGGAPRAKKNLTPVFLGIGVSALAAGIGAFFLVTVPAPAPTQGTNPPEPLAVIPPPPPPAPPIPEIPAIGPLTPPAPARQVKALWAGKATNIRGLAIGPGAPCIIDGTLESDGNKPRVVQLSVKCSNKVVYDSSDKLEGMSMSGYGMAEEPGKEPGTFAYAVNYSDTGARSGPRTQVSIDTTHGQGAVWSEIVPIFRVEFRVPTLSVPVKGEALVAATRDRNFEER